MEVKKIFLTKENLLEIQKIDDNFYTNAITGIDWYLERYNKNHYAYCLFDDDKIVGYIVSVPIKKELYDTIVNGVLLNDLHINPQMFLNESNYNYIVSCVIKEEYRYKNYGKLLMETLLNDLKDSYACCLTISKAGYKLANNYLKLKMKLNDEVSVFEK
ncbi:MAG: GNAT family N-acetyltransferase [Firmicutes bacterium]|nr:GNAT family N-acetyltransferase [Bacillota bacterium]